MVATSYNFLGAGFRRRLITVTTTANITNGPLSNLVSGKKQNDNAEGLFCTTNETGRQFVFEFPFPVVVDEFTWYQDAAGTQGTYTLSGSNDGSTYTNITTGINLGGASAVDVHAFTNTTYYKFYKLLSTAGSTSNSRWLQEIEFKVSEEEPQVGTPTPAGPTSYTNLYGSGNRSAAATMLINHRTACNENWLGDMPGMLDGVVGNNCSLGAAWNVWTDAVILFIFPTPIIIDEIKWKQQLASAHGVWTFAGSVDGITFTDLQTGIALGGAAVSTYPITNTTGYHVYRLTQTSGSTSSATWLNEVEFKTAEVVYLDLGYEGTANFVDEDGFTALPTFQFPVHPVVAFSDDDGFRAVPLILPSGIVAPIGFKDDEGFAATPHITPKLRVNLVANFSDDLGISRMRVTLNTKRVFKSAHFVDEAAFAAKPTLNTKRVYPDVHFGDDAGFRAMPTINPNEKGPFFLGWANEGEEFSSGVHGLVSEDVFAFNMKHREGEFAQLTIVLKNPRIGILNPARKRWAFLSVRLMNDAGVYDDFLTPLFYGRVVGVPTNVFKTLVTLSFVARPYDFTDRKAALAATMRNRPYWDSLFLKPESWADDDTVLEARSSLWHTDRVTHDVTVSDIIVPEDGVIEFTEDMILYESVELTLGDQPVRSVTVQSTIPWVQTATGGIDISSKLGRGIVYSFTFDGLQSDWPKQGDKIGTGWVVQSSDFSNVAFTAIPEAKIPEYFDKTTIPAVVAEGSYLFPVRVTGGEYHSGEEAGFTTDVDMVIVPIGGAFPKMVVTYASDRDFSQQAVITMRADVQDVLTLAPESDNKVITIAANKASDPDYDGTLPIGDLRNRAFFDLPRGQQALEHLMLVARANLISSSRVIEISYQVALMEALPLLISCRKGALVHDRRFPGGQAIGKIVDYEFDLDGNDGTALATIKIACAVGRGGSYERVDGEPTYVDEDYCDDDYQEYINTIEVVGVQDDFTYTMPQHVDFDDAVDFRSLTAENIVKSVIITNTADQQREVLDQWIGADQATISDVLQDIPTTYALKLLPLRDGPFEGALNVPVADLVLPKQIDLEAPSNE